MEVPDLRDMVEDEVAHKDFETRQFAISGIVKDGYSCLTW